MHRAPHSLLAFGVKIDAFNATRDLVEANVVKALEACPAYCADAVVWHQKILFPAHEEMLLLHPVLGYQFRTRRVF